MGMKHVVWIIPALLLGLVLGGWGPRSDLRRARKEIAELKAQAAERSHLAGQFGKAKALLGISDAEIKRRGIRRADERRTAETGDVPTNAPVAGATTNGPSSSRADTNGTPRPNLEKQLEQATELWNTRAALARNSFVTNTGLNEEQTTRFDVLIAGMNLRIEDTIARWAETLQAKDTPTPEDGIRLVNEISDAMVLTYNELDRNMPEDWRGSAGKQFDLTQLIDPAVAMPLVDVEDKLRDSRPSRRRGPPWRRRRRAPVEVE